MKNPNIMEGKGTAYFCANKGTITKVSHSFLTMTEYEENEVLGIDTDKMFKMLRMNLGQDEIKPKYREKKLFIFTKNLEAREVRVRICQGTCADETIYIFLEKTNYSIEKNMIYIHQLCKFNTTPIAVYSVPDLRLLKASQMYLDIIPKPYNKRELAIGRTLSELAPEWEQVKCFWESLIKAGETVQIKEKKLGDKYRDTTYTPIFEDKTLKFIVVNPIECTERVLYRMHLEEQAKQIQEQNRKMEVVLDNLSDAVFLYDKDMNILLSNKAGREEFTFAKVSSAEQAYELIDCYDGEGNKISLQNLPVHQVMRGEKLIAHRFSVKFPQKTIHMSVSGSPIYDEEGNIAQAVTCFRDITENVEHEEALKQQQQALLDAEKRQKLELQNVISMKDEFFSFISHEFKTPLTVINSAIQAMESLCKNELSVMGKRYINRIRQNSFRQLRLVNNLLDITRAEAGYIKVHKKNMDILQVTRSITESVVLYARQKGIRVQFDSILKSKTIALDEEKYERILLNLLSNAIKFTPEGKKILVKVSLNKQRVYIKVKDEGVGIPKEKQEVIFDRFGQVDSSLTRMAEGTGIGLCLVRLLIQAMGGEISVDSKVGRGTTFTVEVPDAQIDEEEQEPTLEEISDHRLVQSVAIEFSDIYIN